MMASEKTITISREEYERFLSQSSRISILEHQLSELKRMIFGAKSERFIATDTDQMTLFDLPEQQTEPQEPEEEQITYTRNKSEKKKNQPLRLELASHLPRQEEIIEPENIPGKYPYGELHHRNGWHNLLWNEWHSLLRNDMLKSRSFQWHNMTGIATVITSSLQKAEIKSFNTHRNSPF